MAGTEVKSYEEQLAEHGMTPKDMERYIAIKEFKYAFWNSPPMKATERLVSWLARRRDRS